ncbi:MAG: ABC transporter ATP-binding protein [Chthoniobacterales bacterium]
MSDVVIRAENVGKKYRLGRAGQSVGYRTLRDTLSEGARNLFGRNGDRGSAEEFWALRDLSFEITQGEVVGIIGRNGAGKSTLLKILSRITEPTSGKVRITGRVASLLEVGTGFHPELTGRENIFLNGAILGMARVEIKAKFDEIVAFAEVEKFLDTPVKRYSSGMYVRLAFAVAAHLEPEILIVDEVLAVGDSEFQRKCLGKMKDVSRAGRTVLLVSHTMPAISALCTKAILMQSGRIAASGYPDDVIRTYLGRSGGACYEKEISTQGSQARIAKAWIRLSDDGSSDEGAASEIASSSMVELVVRAFVPVGRSSYLVASFWDELKRPLWTFSAGENPFIAGAISETRIKMKLPPLSSTVISVDLAVGATHTFDDHVVDAFHFTVQSSAEHKGGGQQFPLQLKASFAVSPVSGSALYASVA